MSFIPAEQYIREQPLQTSLADLAAAHVIESKRPVRCIADLLGAHLQPRMGIAPRLRKRQTMEAIK